MAKNTIELTDRQVIQLKSVLKYAHKAYTSRKKDFKEQTGTVMLELLAVVKDQTK